MAERIPQSVAYLVVFRAFLASDGKTPATGKTIAITISKNGATSFSTLAAGATNATEMASGFYKFTLATGDTDTAGPLAWRGAEGTINDAGDVLSVVNANNGGFAALPNAAAEAEGGLYTRGTGAGQLNQAANGQVDVNMMRAAGNADTPTILDRAARTMTRFTVGSGSTTTNIVTSSITPAATVADQFKNQGVRFDLNTTTANLRGQYVPLITSSTTGASAALALGSALTDAPVSGDTGVVV